jgi:enediyne biosynthesis protein E4
MFRWLLLLCLFSACAFSCKPKTLFKKISADKSGVHFNNRIPDTDSLSILELEYIYNGGGVAIADFNNDGLDDLFFTGNMVENKMYLNQGDLQFRELNDPVIGGSRRWSTGVATVDINNDGLMDLYVCASIKKHAPERANMLFVNKGVDKNGNPSFKDEAAAYHLADTGHSTTAAFFDYDNDTDLDLYVLTNMMVDGRYPNQYRRKITDGTSPNNDRLYRNDFDSTQGHPVFTDVTRAAGINIEGFGLGLNITDINKDGWKDIYVTNDYLSNDLLWINNRNGSFTNEAAAYFKHTSYSAMGNDVADINNDGLMDIIAVDMLPETNYRKKMMMSANSYQSNLNNDEYRYEYQYGRNTLQLNQGNAIKAGDSITHPVFSEIGFLAGVAETDWSWTPMVADFDNDGFRDLIITNGFPKDITDHDFMTFRAEANKIASREDILQQIPAVKLPNYAFKNNGDLTFSNKSKAWGLDLPTFSNGAAYADLDKDGDLDMVINNINDEALVYENTIAHRKAADHYLQLSFKGSNENLNGIGTWVELYYGGKMQAYENTPYRGYLSSLASSPHFGLGHVEKVDSLLIKWPEGKMQRLRNVRTNQRLVVDVKNANLEYSFDKKAIAEKPLFSEWTDSLSINYIQQEIDFADFNIQKLLPHKLSEYGPAMAVGDVDGNSLEDLILGGSYGFSSSLFLQQKNGRYLEKKLLAMADQKSKKSEDMGIALFDADGDNDLDLHIASGSYENPPASEAYQDKFYSNDGKGNFFLLTTGLPVNTTSKSCVRPFDYDHDGDLDLFLAGRVEPWNYPKPVSSFIYRNDSKKGQIIFTDVTEAVAKNLLSLGLVCDAVSTDFNNDGWQDLVLAGEWMPVTFLKNNHGKFENVTTASGVSDQQGLWSSILPGDFDNDGDMDYIAANLGLNSFYRASREHPARLYAKDFDNNGSYDAIPSLYLPDETGRKYEFTAQTRDDLVKQMIGMRSKFQNYKTYAIATFDKILSPEELKDALILSANNFRSSIIINKGNSTFEIRSLPMEAQLSMLNGMLAEDFDRDGNLDLVINGNDFGTEVSVGRYDALNGLYLKGDGAGNFKAVSMLESGVFIPGNGKALVKSVNANGDLILFASQNRGALKAFRYNRRTAAIPVSAEEQMAYIHLKNGKIRKHEVNFGCSFLSQSSRLINVDETITSLEIKDRKGNTRKISFP